MKIAFDIDGVCADLGPIMESHLLSRYGYDLVSKQHRIIVPGVSKKELWEMFDHLVVEHLYDIQPFPGLDTITEYVYFLTEEPIYFCTARKKDNEPYTRKWLDEHVNVPYELGHAGSTDKARHLQKRGYTALVEDRFSTANLAAKILDKVFLVNQAWNAGREADPRVTRVDSLYELINHI